MHLLPEYALTRRDTIHHCKAETLLNALPTGCVDLIVTSPPYDNLRTYNGFTWDFETIAHQSYRVLKPGGVLVWVVGDATINGSETLTSMRQALYFKDVVGFNAWDTMIWQKDTPLQIRGSERYAPVFEFMFVFSKGKVHTFNPLQRKNAYAGTLAKSSRRQRNGKNVVYKDRSAVNDESPLSNVWYIAAGFNCTTKDTEAFQHPAMFPEKLAERHILTWSNPGDLVLDYFMGSGTTAKMARKNGRHYLGCDLSAEYVEIARQRLAQPYTLPMFERAVGE